MLLRSSITTPNAMPKRRKLNKVQDSHPVELKGWKQIADFLGEPLS